MSPAAPVGPVPRGPVGPIAELEGPVAPAPVGPAGPAGPHLKKQGLNFELKFSRGALISIFVFIDIKYKVFINRKENFP
jgi:hypothetical protein